MLSVVGFDRFLMAFSLAVHIILASIGIALPAIIVIAEFLGIRKKDIFYTAMARRLSIVLIVLFAIGTASGTLVALELFLLWPKFIALVGQVAILPLYIEVFAFFLEAIFLGIYVYSWGKFNNKYIHNFIGVLVAIGGAMSAVLITILNSFMNTPTGFNIPAYLSNGTITGVSPLGVFSSSAAAIEVPHVLATAYFAGSFIFAAYMAYRMLKSTGNSRIYYKKALYIIFGIIAVSTILSIITGIISINTLAAIQPEKYAALELNLISQPNAPEVIFGTYSNNAVIGAITIPGLQSRLLGSPSDVAPGLSQFQQSTWPPLAVHDMFDAMVFLGFGFGIFILLIIILFALRKNPFERKIILYLFIIAGIFAVLLLELGWSTAEIARQPWIIYNVMLVSTAANYSESVIPIAILFIIIYAAIIPFTLIILKRIFRDRNLEYELVEI